MSESTFGYSELSKVLTPLASKHNLSLNRTIWMLHHSSKVAFDNQIFDYQLCEIHEHDDELHFTSKWYDNIPQYLLKAVLENTNLAQLNVVGFIDFPTEEDLRKRKERIDEKRRRRLQKYESNL